MKLRAALVCTIGARPSKHTHAINCKSSSTGFLLYMINIVCHVADRFAWWQAAQRSQLIKLAVSRGPRVVVLYTCILQLVLDFYLPSKEVVGYSTFCCEYSYHWWDDVRQEHDVMDRKCVGRGGVIRGPVAVGLAGVKASAHRTRPSAAACGQKSVLLYIASSVANRKRPDAAAGGRPLVSLQFCIWRRFVHAACSRWIPKNWLA